MQSSNPQAVTEDGELYTWGQDSGSNDLGWLHEQVARHKVPRKKEPELVKDIADVVAVALGGMHSLALTRGGHVWAFGDSSAGQCGLTE